MHKEKNNTEHTKDLGHPSINSRPSKNTPPTSVSYLLQHHLRQGLNHLRVEILLILRTRYILIYLKHSKGCDLKNQRFPAITTSSNFIGTAEKKSTNFLTQPYYDKLHTVDWNAKRLWYPSEIHPSSLFALCFLYPMHAFVCFLHGGREIPCLSLLVLW